MILVRFPLLTMRFLRPVLVPALTLALMACAGSHGLHSEGRLLAISGLQTGKTLAAGRLSPADWPTTDWWRTFGDPQLDTLIEEGLHHSPSLDTAVARLRQAQAQAGAADANRQPSVSVSVGYFGLQLPESMVGSRLGGKYTNGINAMLDFRYVPDLWGGKRAAWEATVDQAHAAQIDTQAARLNLIDSIAEAYAQLAYIWALQDVVDADLTRVQRTLHLTRQRRSAGIDSDVQLRQVQSRMLVAEQQRQVVQQQMSAARIALAALVGQGPDRGLKIQRPVLNAALALQLPSVLPTDLLGHRPDVVAARWRVEAFSKSIDAAKAEFYPSLNLTVLGGLVNKDIGSLVKSASALGLVAPALSLPMFHGNTLRANLADRDAQYDLAVADYNAKVLGALREVADQVTAMRSLQQQLQGQQQALHIAQASLELAQQRYRAGISSYLEVLNVQQQLLSVRQELAQLQYQQVVASMKLRTALGGGFASDVGRTTAVPSVSSHF
ncbi:MAG TPA: efflux transporter outer membrane subunit [Xylella taiwanensis]